MSEWKQCTLADLGEIVGGATPSTKNEDYYGGDIAWITPKDLSTFHGRFISHGERNTTVEGLKNSSARLMPPHSVLFTSRAPIGYVAIAENEVCTNQGFKSIVPNSDTDYLFLYYLLVHNRDRIKNMGSGTTFKEVSGAVMKQISVSVPTDIEEQKSISAILGALDDKIENNTKINHHLEQMAQAIFKSWFVDFEPFGGEMPDDWRKGILGDILQSIKQPIKAGERTELPYVPIDRIPMNSLALTDFRPNQEAQSSLLAFEKNDILIGAMRVYFHRVSIAPFDGITRTTCFILRPRERVYLEYALLLCNEDSTIDFAQNTSKGSTMPYAVWDNGLANLPIVIPTVDVAQEFSHTLRPIIEQLRDSLFEIRHLSSLRDSILPCLMSGKISVADF
jgi:type I restriction enzyme S subunit